MIEAATLEYAYKKCRHDYDPKIKNLHTLGLWRQVILEETDPLEIAYCEGIILGLEEHLS